MPAPLSSACGQRNRRSYSSPIRITPPASSTPSKMLSRSSEPVLASWSWTRPTMCSHAGPSCRGSPSFRISWSCARCRSSASPAFALATWPAGRNGSENSIRCARPTTSTCSPRRRRSSCSSDSTCWKSRRHASAPIASCWARRSPPFRGRGYLLPRRTSFWCACGTPTQRMRRLSDRASWCAIFTRGSTIACASTSARRTKTVYCSRHCAKRCNDRVNVRHAEITRNTKETQIRVKVNLDGQGAARLSTGLPFLEHMLDQVARHAMLDLEIEAKGDLHIDAHHTVEDIGITLGQAVAQAVGDKSGVRRFGHAYVPLDEALSRVVIDFSGRPGLAYQVKFTRALIGEFDVDLVHEFFQGFVNHAQVTLHIDNLRGDNAHHQCETMFKAFARALRMAAEADPRAAGVVPSTKGSL